MKKNIGAFLLITAGLWAANAQAQTNGISVYGDEAREVFNSLTAAGATQIGSEQGPEVVIDNLDCVQGTADSTCTFKGDPKLTSANGAIAERLTKALLGVNVVVKNKTISLKDVDCGILSYPPSGNSVGGVRILEEASCYFVDNNNSN